MLSSCGLLPRITASLKLAAFSVTKNIYMYRSEHSTDYSVVVCINALAFLDSITSVYKTSAWPPSINPCLHPMG
jgi:hypothetical protein